MSSIISKKVKRVQVIIFLPAFLLVVFAFFVVSEGFQILLNQTVNKTTGPYDVGVIGRRTMKRLKHFHLSEHANSHQDVWYASYPVDAEKGSFNFFRYKKTQQLSGEYSNYPVVIFFGDFNMPGLRNQFLMKELASNGYIVFASNSKIYEDNWGNHTAGINKLIQQLHKLNVSDQLLGGRMNMKNVYFARIENLQTKNHNKYLSSRKGNRDVFFHGIRINANKKDIDISPFNIVLGDTNKEDNNTKNSKQQGQAGFLSPLISIIGSKQFGYMDIPLVSEISGIVKTVKNLFPQRYLKEEYEQIRAFFDGNLKEEVKLPIFPSIIQTII